jgi:hypothetical protein
MVAEAARRTSNKSLQQTIAAGTAFHTAALDFSDRDLCEQLFRSRLVTVLCCTSTLAMGGASSGQINKICHIDMGDDRIDTVISHVIRPYPVSICRMPISISRIDIGSYLVILYAAAPDCLLMITLPVYPMIILAVYRCPDTLPSLAWPLATF